MKNLFAPTALVLALGIAAPAKAAPEDDYKQLREEVWQATLDSSPQLATSIGDRRGDGRLGNLSIEEFDRLVAESRAFLARLEAIDPDDLPEDLQVDYAILKRSFEDGWLGPRSITPAISCLPIVAGGSRALPRSPIVPPVHPGRLRKLCRAAGAFCRDQRARHCAQPRGGETRPDSAMRPDGRVRKADRAADLRRLHAVAFLAPLCRKTVDHKRCGVGEPAGPGKRGARDRRVPVLPGFSRFLP